MCRYNLKPNNYIIESHDFDMKLYAKDLRLKFLNLLCREVRLTRTIQGLLGGMYPSMIREKEYLSSSFEDLQFEAHNQLNKSNFLPLLMDP